jgi:hypothetical protein
MTKSAVIEHSPKESEPDHLPFSSPEKYCQRIRCDYQRAADKAKLSLSEWARDRLTKQLNASPTGISGERGIRTPCLFPDADYQSIDYK